MTVPRHRQSPAGDDDGQGLEQGGDDGLAGKAISTVPGATSSLSVGRAAWSVAAQGLASASNFGVQFGLVLTMSAASFGAVVVGFAVFYLVLALGRAWVGDPLVAIAETPADVARLWPDLRRRLLALGAAAAVAVLCWSAIAEGVRVELVILALAIPGLLLQDGHRYRAWALRLHPRVVWLDAAWLVVSALVVLSVIVVRGSAVIDGRIVMLAWVSGGIVSWLLARMLDGQALVGRSDSNRGEPPGPSTDPGRPDDGADWEEGRRASQRLTAQQAVLAVDANGLPVAVSAVASATATAAVRAVVLPFAPMTSVLSGIRVLALPMLRHAVRRGHVRATVSKVVALYVVVAVVMSAAILMVLTVVPIAWLGESGQLVQAWFPLGAVVVAGRMIGLPLADVLSLGVEQVRVARIRVLTSAVDWAATLGGAVLIGLEGAIGGRAVAAVVSLCVWAVMVARSLDGTAAEHVADEADRLDTAISTVTGGGPQQ